LATRYERALQESEGVTEKFKNRLDFASEELERVLLQKEGESTKDTGVRSAAGGAAGKRAIGKAVVKGGLLLKGKNPGNVSRLNSLNIPLRMVFVDPTSGRRHPVESVSCFRPLSKSRY